MVLFCELFGGAMNLPKEIIPWCYDINQELFRKLCDTPMQAFDHNREELMIVLSKFELCNKLVVPMNVKKHNSLWDAKVIKYIYEALELLP